MFAMLCMVNFFTACSDDDDATSKGWEGLSRTYEDSNSLAILLGEATLPLGNKSVVVEAASADKATLILNNVIPETAALTVNANLSEANGVYAVSGEETVNSCTVTLNGTFDDGKLSLVINRKMPASVAGTWKMKISSDSGTSAAGVYTNIVTGNTQLDAMIGAMAGPMVGQLIAKKVEAVTAVLGEDGLFGASWKSVGASEATDISSYTNALSIQYCLVDGQLMIAVDKAYVELLQLLSGQLAEYGLTVESITALLTDLGGYYALPLHFKTEGNEATFYLSKEIILPLVELATPILTPLIPENYQDLVTTLLALLPTAEALDFGLVFLK